MESDQTEFRNSLLDIIRFFSAGWSSSINPRDFITFWWSLPSEEQIYYRMAKF